MATSSSDRFSDRVADYVRWRPDYPEGAIGAAVAALGLEPGVTVADIGAGTGILTHQLAGTGADVIAVDPNERMLDAARELLADVPNVRIVVGAAEATGLGDASVDAITAGQAFHWFDHRAARREFQRILRPGGRVALVWNSKAFGSSAFLAEYEQLLDALVPEFGAVRHEKTADDELVEFYGHEPARFEFPHAQRFDWTGVYGRVMSSSYAPKPGDPVHDELVEGMRACFDAHSADGEVTWPYTTTLYVGALR